MVQNYMIPGLYENYKMNICFLDFYKKNPTVFKDNINFRCVFGNFLYCSWDGGRIFPNYVNILHSNKEEIEKIQKIYNETFQLPMRFVFTNKLIEEKDCYDRFNNLVLEICQNDMNEIVINSPILEDYIRKNYPQYKFISSTTKCITNREKAKEEIFNSNYIMTCLDYNLNKDYNFLNSLSQSEKDKVELLINPVCGPACPNRAQHYKLNSLYMLNYGKPYAMRSCIINGSCLLPIDNNVIITPEEIENYYSPQGFSNFKIEGRTFPPLDLLLNLVKYTVKPEYSYFVISSVMRAYNSFNL